MAAQFTPGPWRVLIDDDGNPLSGRPGVFASEELDCGIVHWDGFVQPYWRSARGDKEIHANAHLMAASPELYEALEIIFKEWQSRVNDDSGWPDDAAAVMNDAYKAGFFDKAKAALSKARGETPSTLNLEGERG